MPGVYHGVTTGGPITLRLVNKDAKLERLAEPAAPRGGHIDLAGAINYQTGIRQVLERASARETAMRVAVGGLARLLLGELGIGVFGYVVELGGIAAPPLSSRSLGARRQPGLHARTRKPMSRSSRRSTRPRRPATRWEASSRRSSPAARSAWARTPSGIASSTPGWPRR